MLTLETDRLILRAFEVRDVEGFAAYRSDPDVARYQGWDIPFTELQAVEFIRAMRRVQAGAPGKWLQLAIQVKSSGELAGDCAFKVEAEDPHQAEMGLTIARKFQRQGYGFEATVRLLDYLFFELKMHRVRAGCDELNLVSCHLLEKIGLRREAHLIENLWFKGRWSSEYWFGILDREWAARRGVSLARGEDVTASAEDPQSDPGDDPDSLLIARSRWQNRS
ncbi:acetyltransferase [Longilinea arvoryzae]|uniref:Acetyltransferase n=1 Tax=Longilinea arvoryzae TaxID=360412 RepID=A0A0S7BEV9_9CHLR|nr:GNAT family protein [Longilinea arvoryzae]GAP12546.1 acetyltransferase [Longilinea arvoryzae]